MKSTVSVYRTVKKKRAKHYKLDRLIDRFWETGTVTNATESDSRAFERAQRELANYVARNRDRIVWLPR